MRRTNLPGLLTRAELLALTGASSKDLDTLERQDICRPTQRRSGGDTRPVVYDLVEAGLVTMALHAATLGVRGKRLGELLELVRIRRSRLTENWSGMVVFDGAGVDLVPDGVDISAWLQATPPPKATLILHLRVPGGEM